MSNLTLKDISKALQLSVSTISKSLNDSYEISDATKKIVLDFVEKHNYQPNRLAKSLKSGKTNTIGVIACSLNNIFMAQVFEGMQQAALGYNYEIIMMQSSENVTIEQKALELMVSRNVDGILIAPVSETSNKEFLLSIQQNNCPLVFFDRISNSLNTHKIGSNDFAGAYEGTKKLIEINRNKILFIGGATFSEKNQRILGYKKALQDHGIPFNKDFLLLCDLDDTSKIDAQIKKGIQQCLSQKISPNAIFGATDVITTRTLGILSELKIHVPDQLAVIGFSNTEIAFALNPSLSTIYQPANKIGFLALEKMVELLNLKSTSRIEYETILLDTEIQLRNSTRVDNECI